MESEVYYFIYSRRGASIYVYLFLCYIFVYLWFIILINIFYILNPLCFLLYVFYDSFYNSKMNFNCSIFGVSFILSLFLFLDKILRGRLKDFIAFGYAGPFVGLFAYSFLFVIIIFSIEIILFFLLLFLASLFLTMRTLFISLRIAIFLLYFLSKNFFFHLYFPFELLEAIL